MLKLVTQYQDRPEQMKVWLGAGCPSTRAVAERLPDGQGRAWARQDKAASWR